MSVPVEWEHLQALRSTVGGGGDGASPEPDLPLQRSHSSGDAIAAPFGGQSIPEGHPFAPTALVLPFRGSIGGSPFANGLQAVAAGGTLSLAAMQAAASGSGGKGRHSNSSLNSASTADKSNSMHSNASEPHASMAGEAPSPGLPRLPTSSALLSCPPACFLPACLALAALAPAAHSGD